VTLGAVMLATLIGTTPTLHLSHTTVLLIVGLLALGGLGRYTDSRIRARKRAAHKQRQREYRRYLNSDGGSTDSPQHSPAQKASAKTAARDKTSTSTTAPTNARAQNVPKTSAHFAEVSPGPTQRQENNTRLGPTPHAPLVASPPIPT
jgi:type II secretory pathway pseudopilin PulG